MAEALPLRSLDIDWVDLEIAYRDNVSGVNSFLDLETGEVLTVISERDLEAAAVAREPERFEPIPMFSREEGIEVLREYVDQLPDSKEAAELRLQARSQNALSRCLELLAADVHLFSGFCEFEEEAIYTRLLLWLAALGLCAVMPPPQLPPLALISPPEIETV